MRERYDYWPNLSGNYTLRSLAMNPRPYGKYGLIAVLLVFVFPVLRFGFGVHSSVVEAEERPTGLPFAALTVVAGEPISDGPTTNLELVVSAADAERHGIPQRVPFEFVATPDDIGEFVVAEVRGTARATMWLPAVPEFGDRVCFEDTVQVLESGTQRELLFIGAPCFPLYGEITVFADGPVGPDR